MTRSSHPRTDANGIDRDRDPTPSRRLGQEQDIDLLRQQSENSVYTAYESLDDLCGIQGQEQDVDVDKLNDTDSDRNEMSGNLLQVHVSRPRSDDTANWLFNLAFLRYVESRGDSIDQDSESYPDSAGPSVDEDGQGSPSSQNHNNSTSRSLVLRRSSDMGMTIYSPGAATSLVKVLLSDWTVLTEGEIQTVTGDKQIPKDEEPKTFEISQEQKETICFRNTAGQKFRFPFNRVKTYEVRDPYRCR